MQSLNSQAWALQNSLTELLRAAPNVPASSIRGPVNALIRRARSELNDPVIEAMQEFEDIPTPAQAHSAVELVKHLSGYEESDRLVVQERYDPFSRFEE